MYPEKLTRAEVLKALKYCSDPSNISCLAACPMYGFAPELENSRCMAALMEIAIPFVKESVPATVQTDTGLIGGIMGHYKKPLVTISISEMEETE